MMRLSKTNKENAIARSAAANEARRARERTVVDWDECIARWRNILDDILPETSVGPQT